MCIATILTIMNSLAAVAIAYFAFINNKTINKIQNENARLLLSLIASNFINPSQPYLTSDQIQRMQKNYKDNRDFIIKDLAIPDPEIESDK